MRKIIVASKNPVKINAALIGFQRMFPDDQFEIEGVSVHSGVSGQPKSGAETFAGAMNRVMNALQESPDADFHVGIEGGIDDDGEHMIESSWVVIRSREGRFGRGRTGTFPLPPRIAELIRCGQELSEAADAVFCKTNIREDNGAVGVLTHDVIDRTKYCSEAVVYALIPFKNPDLYFGEVSGYEK